MIQFISNRYSDRHILHNCHKYVTVTYLQSLSIERRKTIQLVYTQKLQITGSDNSWRGSIFNDCFNKLDLDEAKITDPEFINKLKLGYTPHQPCLVTVSLSMPWKPPSWEKEAPCWKLITGIIELF